MPRRLRVFVSSTMTDLAAEREAVESSIASLGPFEAVLAESLPASERSSRQVCLEEIGEADAVVLILGRRYGSIPAQENPEQLSVTHLEFREARRLKKPILVFLRPSDEPEPGLAKLTSE